ncbi:Fructose-2,6-bisphosphatase [Entomortierella beljakovae]|nr:Fructose-2,6-bisphosphatase [Entomortierella beljakovae]
MVFSVGNYRRKLFGSYQPHLFFDSANAEGEQHRAEAANEAFSDMMFWLQADENNEDNSARVAIYDATSSTRTRRSFILQECHKNDIEVMFIESIYENEDIRMENILEMQKFSPDYSQLDAESAIQDFRARIGYFKGNYETITEKDLTYIKLIDAGSDVIISRIKGYLQSRVHGESLFNVMSLLGGDSDLSPRGKQYAQALPSLVAKYIPNSEKLTVWTSTKKRTIATAKHLPHPKVAWKALDELEAGKADGLTYEQVEEQFPEDFAKRDSDKYLYRYQDGESYRDVVERLEPVIMDLERQDDILIIGHQAILRCLYAYFMNYPTEKLPYIKIPLHTLIQITPGPYSCEEKRFKVDIEAVDTHRPKPKASTNSASGSQENQDDPFVKAAPSIASPSIPALSEKDKALQNENAGDIPRIILSHLTTNTFRDSIYTTAESVSKSNEPKVTSRLPAVTTTTTINRHPSFQKQDAPSQIDIPSVSEKTKQIAEVLLQSNALEFQENPSISMNSVGIVTPLPEQENGGVRGPILGLDLDISGNSRHVQPDTATTPPLSPVSSSPLQELYKVGPEPSSDRVAAIENSGKRDGSLQLATNPGTVAAACV